MESVASVRIAGFQVQSSRREQLAQQLLQGIAAQRKQILFFANTNFIVKCRPLLERIAAAPVTLVNDGVGMDIASKLIAGGRFEQNLNGTDFVPYLFSQAAGQNGQPLRVFMIGSTAEVLEKASRHVQTQLGQQVVGVCDGFGGVRDIEALNAQLLAARPDVVLVAMGNPLQEEWILRHYAGVPASLFIGVGALFDFWSGGKSRAPRAVQAMRLEWLYRLMLEPRRLLRRYTWDILVFLGVCYRYRQH